MDASPRGVGRGLGWLAAWLAAGVASAAPIEIVHHGPQPSVVGQSIVVSTRIGSPDGGQFQPTGSITISDGVDSCTATLPVATCAWTPSTPGMRTLTASYAGDGNFLPSSDSETHFVEPVSLPERVSLGEPLLTYDESGMSCCYRAAFSADGRFVAFGSHYSLTLAEFNGYRDIYLLDRHSGELSLVSVDSSGAFADGDSYEVAISPDGRFIAFSSDASNLVAGDSNGVEDVFLRDRMAGTTVRVSVSDSELQSTQDSHEPDVSANGRRVVFKSRANLAPNDINTDGSYGDVFVRDLDSDGTILVSAGTGGTSLTGDSYTPTISDDGNRVAFQSTVPGLTASDSNGSQSDVFVRDLGGAFTELASVDSNEVQSFANADSARIAPDGSRVLLTTSAAWDVADGNGTWDCYVRDLQAGTTLLASRTNGGPASSAGVNPFSCALGGTGVVWFTSMATDFVADPDEASSLDLFRHDLDTGDTTRVTRGARDGLPSQSIGASDDGRHATYRFENGAAVPGTSPGGGSEFALYDDGTGTTSGVKLDLRGNQSDTSAPGGPSGGASISADGRYVAFVSTSANLNPYKLLSFTSDVFVRDRLMRTTELISRGLNDFAADGNSFAPAISADGRYVAFLSTATNLVPGDAGGTQDVFHYDRDSQTLRRVSGVTGGVEPDNHSHHPSISADGRYVAFDSQATTLVAGDSNNRKDVFRWDRDALPAAAIEQVSVASDETPGNFDSDYASISADGRRVVFQSGANNLSAVGGPDGQVFLRDLDAGTTVQLSVVPGNTAPDGQSYDPTVSADARYVVFGTTATNLAPAQPGPNRVLRLDRTDGSMQAVLDAGGQPIAEGFTDRHANLSADGRYLALISDLALEPSDVDAAADLYVYDFDSERGRMVLGPSGAEPLIQTSRHSLALSADGVLVTARADSSLLVSGDSNGVADQFVFANPVFNLDAEQQVETLTPSGDDASLAPASDASGRYIVFQSDAGNLAPGDANGASDIFRVDTETGATVRLSLNDDGSPLGAASIEPAVSADGSAVLFVSADTGITKVFGETAKQTKARAKAGGWSVLLRNTLTGTTQRMGAGQPSGSGTAPRIAPSASAIVYSAPNPDPMQGTPGQTEVFHVPLQRVGANLVAGTPRCVSCKTIDAAGQDTAQNSDGASRAPAVSANGEWVAWETESKNALPAAPLPCPDTTTVIMLRNLITGAAQRASVPAAPSNCGAPGSSASKPSLDWSGRKLVFTTDQPLASGDANGAADAYLLDLDLQRLTRVSQTDGGGDGNGDSTGATISGDGKSIAFVSAATNLDPAEPDDNGFRDTHVRSLVGGAAAVRRLSRTRTGGQADSHSQRPALNYNGTRLAFDSDAGNLAPGAQAGVLNVFQRANPLNGELVFGTGFE